MKKNDKYPNLIPNSERSPDELREMGRKGGIKSGEARRRAKRELEVAKLWLKVFDDLERQGMSMEDVSEKLSELFDEFR